MTVHIQKVLPGLEEHASKTKRYPRWPLTLENVLRLKYPDQLSLGEHEQVLTQSSISCLCYSGVIFSHRLLHSVTLWHLEKLSG